MAFVRQPNGRLSRYPAEKTMLLSLPGEIRQIVWEFIFTLPEKETSLIASPRNTKEKSVLRILTVCKTIYAEALHLFYAKNHLHLATTQCLFNFLASITPLRRCQITAISVANYGLHWTSTQLACNAFSELLLCPNLATFRLDLSMEESWNILKERRNGDRVNWDAFHDGLICLASLRGVKHASIRGLRPADLVNERGTELEEISSPEAEELRLAWNRPSRSRGAVGVFHSHKP